MNRHPLLDVERIEQAPDVYLNSIGSIFAAFDERSQDSGNISYGVQTLEGRYFVKTAGYPDDPNPFLSHSERASLLRNAIRLWRSCDHRTLPPLRQVIESPNGPLLVYQWVDGELVRVDAAMRNDPRSTFQRFRQRPSHEIIRAWGLVYELHHQLAQLGWIAVDFYDGCMIYNFDHRDLHIVDLDNYCDAPFINEMGQMFGSSRFMAPEEFERGARIDERTTVFTMGRTAAVLLSDGTLKRPPFRGGDALYEVVRRSCCADPEKRYDSMTAFFAAWMDALDRRLPEGTQLLRAHCQVIREVNKQVNCSANHTFRLSPEHLAAANRKRRIVVNHQVDGLLCAVEQGLTVEQIMLYEFAFADAPGVHIDAQWWSFDNTFPLEGRPLIDETSPSVPGYVSPERVKVFQQWLDDGINIAEVYIEETKKRGLECFYTYRLNEDPYTEHRELAEARPDWLITGEWAQPLWNFAVPGVRDYKVTICRELVEAYDFDGLEIDFARGPIQTSPGHQWEQREHITEFLHRVRQETLEVEQKCGRPVLLAARIPDNLIGCHFDGLDVETWIRGNLVDFLVLGVRSYGLAIDQFRTIIGDRQIQIFGTLDDHHCTDGYSWPPIEVWRGVVANWWQQGVDAIQTFNWGVAPPEIAQQLKVKTHGVYFDGTRMIPVYQQAYHELGDPEKLKYLNKHFVVQRRGGGGSGGANVDEWHTPRFSYQNTNMLGQLPTTLDNLGLVDALIRLRVSDDFAAEAERIERLTLRLLFSDPGTENLPEGQKIDGVPINPFWDRPQLFTSPARGDMIDRLEVRLNGVLLDGGIVDAGWFIFDTNPKLFAVGINLVSLRVTDRDSQGAAMTVEKVEAHVEYWRP